MTSSDNRQLSSGRALAGPPLSSDPIATAVADLYAACHLPPPGVFVARDVVHFATLIGRLVRSFGFVQAFSCMLLAVMLPSALLWPTGDVVTTTYRASVAVLLVPWVLAGERVRRGIRAALHQTLLRMLATLLPGAAVAAVTYLAGMDHHRVWLSGCAAMDVSACAQLALVLLAPLLWRCRLRRTTQASSRPLPWPTVLWGAARVDAILTTRLASALQDVERKWGRHIVGNHHAHRGPSQWAMQAAFRAAQQARGIWSSDWGLVLGRSVGYSADPAAQVTALASAEIDSSKLPRILQPAVELDRRAEAVAAFRSVAVVLPAGAPARFTPPTSTSRPCRRSGRRPWLDALRWLEDAPGFALILDVVPSDRMADRLVARRLVRLPEAERRTPAIRALGVGRCVEALRLKPIHEDEYGRLYQFGLREDPSVFVAVRDHVLDSNGVPLEHWITVPPHAATAREAVAWSFSMSEAEYQPTKEA